MHSVALELFLTRGAEVGAFYCTYNVGIPIDKFHKFLQINHTIQSHLL